MEEIFTFIEDSSKRLNRPVKDLDDIRFSMAVLKDIREQEIRIDMNITPIEVCNWESPFPTYNKSSAQDFESIIKKI